MDPSIEVQITARLDQLDAGLKMAESKVSQSTKVLGNAGESAGGAFVQRMVGNMVKGLAVGAITNVLGGGILNAVKGIHAGKSGEEIGLDISKGIVDGAKGIPIVGTFVSIFDEVLNGADRLAQEVSEKMAAGFVSALEKFEQFGKKAKEISRSMTRSIEDMRVEDKPEEKIQLEAERKKEARQIEISGIESEAVAAAEISKGVVPKEVLLKQIQDRMTQLRKEAAKEAIAIDQDMYVKLSSLDLEQQEERLNQRKEWEREKVEEAKRSSAEILKVQKEERKANFDAAMQARQDIIDAEQTAQTQASKVGRVDQLAQQAAQGLINSGQTALGQFSFAQGGAGSQAMTLAQKQVSSLEKIEAATAEQVRLTKENQGFR